MEQKNQFACSEKDVSLVFFALVLIIIAYVCNQAWIALGLSLFFMVVILKYKDWKIQIKLGLNTILLCGYLVYTFFATMLSSSYLEEFHVLGLKKISYMVLVFFVFVCMLNNIRVDKFVDLTRKFALVIVVMCFIEAVLRFPVWEYILTLSINDYVSGMIGTSSYRIVGIFKHPIMCAVFLSIALIILVRTPSKNTLKKSIFIVLAIFGLVATKSRSVIIATMVSFLLLFVYDRLFVKKNFRKKRKISRSVLISIPILAIFLGTFIYITKDSILQNTLNLYERFVTMLDAGDAGGDIIRVETMKASFEYFSDRPIDCIVGKGVYASQKFLKNNPIVKGTWQWTAGIDNQYITIVFESGLFGIIMLLIMHIRQFKLIFQKRSETLITYGLIIVMYLVSAFFYEPLLFDNTYVIYVVVNVLLELELKNKLGERYDEK